MRLSLNGEFKKFQFILAEDVNVFAPRDNYGDLLQFESDVAQISVLVILFTESAGSFAELGAFSMVPDITERILVVIDDFFYDQHSFIRLGPIAFLENERGDESVYVLVRAHVGLGRDGHARDIRVPDFSDRLLSAIQKRVATAKGHSTFDPKRTGHMIRLVTGLLQDYGALTDEEILLCLDAMGFSVQRKRLSDYMVSAKAVGWLTRDRNGLRQLNIAAGGREALRFEFQRGAAYINRERWRADVVQHWRRTDPERAEAIEQVRAANGR